MGEGSGATLIASKVSRYVVDLNRAGDDVSPYTVKGQISKLQGITESEFVWRSTTDGIPTSYVPEDLRNVSGIPRPATLRSAQK